MDKIYLPGLNGIRAIAASVVVIFHVDQYIKLFGVEPLGFGNNGMAYFAVDMFFALSGYLITYLLLTEKLKFGKIDLRKFYMRRILRIWPIYYVAIIVTFILYQIGLLEPNSNVIYTFAMFSILLPNVAHAQGLDFVTMFPLWSVGVEEQFYAIWPLLVNKVKKLFIFLTVLVIGYLLFTVVLKYSVHDNFKTLVHYASLDALGLGSITAYLIFKKHPITKLIFHPLTQVVCWIFLAVSLFYKPVHVYYYFDFAMHAGVYAILIANVSANPKTFITLENGIFNFLGKISYGLYIYNMIVIFLAAYFLKDFIATLDSDLYKYLIIFGTSIGFTVLISYISYYQFELRFLKMKAKYSKIHSTNSKSTSEVVEERISLSQPVVQNI
jgi:peptidoglycan/LPS O-acetylase OafA/YrhL